MTQRKIITYIATSADGYIARSDGSVDWLNRPRTADYGMSEFFKSIDTIIWGRKTYDQSLGFGGAGGRGGKKIKNYVFSSKPGEGSKQVEFIHGPIKEFAAQLRAKPGKDIWMMGGGGIIGSFLDAQELDEFIIHVIPIFIGDGIPLIAPKHRTIELELQSTHAFADGVVRLHYKVAQKEE